MDHLTDQISFKNSYQDRDGRCGKLLEKYLSSANVFLAKFNEIDIFQPEMNCTTEVTDRDNNEEQKKDYWQLFVRYLYFHCTFRLILNCILQYIYDFHQFDLRVLLSKDNATTDIAIHEEQISQLKQQIKADRSLIKLLGSPYMNFSFLIEASYIHMVLITFALHILPRIYHRLVEPLTFTLLRALVDRRRELIHCKQVVATEIKKITASSRNFTLAKVADLRLKSKDLFIQQIELTCLNCKQTLRESAEHDLIVKLLKQLASDGFLTPLNRTSKWLDSIGRLTASMQASFFIFCMSHVYFLAFHVTSSKSWLGDIEVETDFMDNVMRCEILILCAIAMLASLFYATTVGLGTVDQIYYLISLKSLAQDCTSMIAHMMQQISEQKIIEPARRLSRPIISRSRVRSGSDIEPLEVSRDLINKKLLRFLIQYRILVCQSKSQKKSCGLIIFIELQAILLAPLLTFIHAPAFKDEIIFVIIYASGFLLLVFDIFIMPACYMHCRGADIYRCMSKLLAAADSLRQVCGDDVGLELYNSYLVLSLRRELHIAQKMIDQFTFGFLGIPFTYENMLRIQFWCSLLLLFALAIYKANNTTSNSNINWTSSFIIL